MGVGKLRNQVDVSHEYLRLAQEDEQAGLLLKENGKYRQAMYFFIQAMEKQVRAKAFSIVDANNEHFRAMNRSHDVDDALAFFMAVINMDSQTKDQIDQMLYTYVTAGTNFRHLHNNLRYPFYSRSRRSHSILDVSKEDCETMLKRLNYLKAFLRDIDRRR